MNEWQKMKENIYNLKRLLDGACIAYTAIMYEVIVDNMPDTYLSAYPDGIKIFGCGYNGVWLYSPEYVVRMLDRKFTEGG